MHCTWRDFKRRGKRIRRRPQENPKRRPSPFWYIIVLNGSLKHTASLSNSALRHDSEQQGGAAEWSWDFEPIQEQQNFRPDAQCVVFDVSSPDLQESDSTYTPGMSRGSTGVFFVQRFCWKYAKNLAPVCCSPKNWKYIAQPSPRSLYTDVSISYY